MTLAHLCLGTASWNQETPYNDRVPPDDAELRRILDVAEAGGVRFIDTAADYGNAERRLMDAWSPGRFKIITKMKPGWFDGRVPLFRDDAVVTLIHYGPEDTIESVTPGYGASVYTVEQATAALEDGVQALQVPWNHAMTDEDSNFIDPQWVALRDRAYADGVLFFGRQPFNRGRETVNLEWLFEWALRTNPRGWCVVGVDTAAQLTELLAWRAEAFNAA